MNIQPEYISQWYIRTYNAEVQVDRLKEEVRLLEAYIKTLEALLEKEQSKQS